MTNPFPRFSKVWFRPVALLGVSALSWAALGCDETPPVVRDAGVVADAETEHAASDAAVCEPTLHLLAYAQAGCGANVPQQQCIGNNSCVMWACSCAGKIVAGCNGFSEPWSYKVGYDGSAAPVVGADCDPDAAH